MGNKFRNRNERNKMRWLLGGSIILILWLIGLNCETQSLMSIGWVALSFLVRSFGCPPASVTFPPLVQFYLFLPPLSCFYQITKPLPLFPRQDPPHISHQNFLRIWVSHSCTLDERCQLEFLDNIEYLCTDPRLNALFINFVWLNISHCLPTCTISALFMSPWSSIIQVLSSFVHLSRAMATMVKVDTKTLYQTKLI